MSDQRVGERIVVVGDSGSGKTTLGAWLANHLAVPHIELDSVHWLPSWRSKSTDQFVADVQAALDHPRWVTDGNYSRVRHVVWPAADTLIWLDFPLWVTIPRLVRRQIKRATTRELLWGTNHERWQNFFSADSPIRYNFKRHRSRIADYEALLADRYNHLRVIRFKRPAELARWQRWLKQERD